jgi:hypothetical protein
MHDRSGEPEDAILDRLRRHERRSFRCSRPQSRGRSSDAKQEDACIRGVASACAALSRHARLGRRAGAEAETSTSRQRQPSALPARCSRLTRRMARDHWVLPAIRAITHVDGKAMRSSRRSTGRRRLVEDDHGASGGRRYRGSPHCVAGGVGGPSSSRRARPPGWSPRGDPLGQAQDDQETFVRGRRLALTFARGCGRRHAPGRRARCSCGAGVSPARVETPAC